MYHERFDPPWCHYCGYDKQSSNECHRKDCPFKPKTGIARLYDWAVTIGIVVLMAVVVYFMITTKTPGQFTEPTNQEEPDVRVPGKL